AGVCWPRSKTRQHQYPEHRRLGIDWPGAGSGSSGCGGARRRLGPQAPQQGLLDHRRATAREDSDAQPGCGRASGVFAKTFGNCRADPYTLVESLAFSTAPANKSVVIKTMMRRFQISDPAVGEEGYQDYLTSIERKPIPNLDGML